MSEQNASSIWSYFAKDPDAKKAKCLHCTQVISFEKSSHSNLKRHLLRKHPFLEHRIAVRVSILGRTIWNHFTKETGKRAKCGHCLNIISYQSTTFSLKRHMQNKHPSVPLDDENVCESPEHEERLYEDSLGAYESSNYAKSFKGAGSGNESDTEGDSKHGLIELQPIDNTELTEPIRIEIIDFNPQSKHTAEDMQEGNEESNHQSDSMNYEHISATHNDLNQTDDINQDEAIIETTNVAQNAGTNVERAQGSCDYLSIGMKDVKVKTAAYATNVALELESLNTRQRIVAEKLISDLLFHAKLENLTEYSMILVKVGTFEKPS
ncbi:uncharacterized protein LOC128724098 [Anopheles nili]|uniref:uncharacterized protein LOC128724098 n=1 Tax=Anopheles nili TaxID=185578 RepID=UPI00237AB0B2|nr:uncharacterized protein LOC128724098 [Anopheles nili]